MKEVDGIASGGRSEHPAPTLSPAGIEEWVDRLGEDPEDLTDAERISRIAQLERLKSAAAAAQARLTVDFDTSQRAAQEAAGVAARRVGAGIAAQVALARREHPVRGQQHLGLAKVLVREMPHTLKALTAGRLSEWQTMLLARETGCLSLEHRRQVDQQLCAAPSTLAGLGDRAIAAAAHKLALELDPAAVVRRSARARADRRVTLRPAPDTMTWLTALLPVEQGVAAYAALKRAADTAQNAGDTRGRGQIMADTLVERTTGQARADATPAAVQLVMTDTSLFDGDSIPAHVDGYGPVPAGWARDLIAQAVETGARAWLRRVFTHPVSGRIVAMDSHSRRVPSGLAALIRTRDGGTCRTPWCDAPIRHSDHAVPARADGPTTERNLAGRCESCNHSKEALGWRARPRGQPDERHLIEITTPTGHTYRSHAPPLPGTPPPASPRSRLDVQFPRLLVDVA
jgi:hypothetical protein